MMPLLVEAVLRSMVLGMIVWAVLKLLRIHNPQTLMTVWVVVLGASLSMPLLTRWLPADKRRPSRHFGDPGYSVLHRCAAGGYRSAAFAGRGRGARGPLHGGRGDQHFRHCRQRLSHDRRSSCDPDADRFGADLAYLVAGAASPRKLDRRNAASQDQRQYCCARDGWLRGTDSDWFLRLASDATPRRSTP
jgi:hypothetical protein